MNMGKNDELNDRQLEFARGLAAGLTKCDAYRKAFDCSGLKGQTVASNACRLAKNANVLKKLEELRGRADSEAGMARGERLRLLAEQARAAAQEGDRTGLARMIDIMNRMDGAYVAEAAAAGADAAFQAAVLRGCEEGRVRR